MAAPRRGAKLRSPKGRSSTPALAILALLVLLLGLGVGALLSRSSCARTSQRPPREKGTQKPAPKAPAPREASRTPEALLESKAQESKARETERESEPSRPEPPARPEKAPGVLPEPEKPAPPRPEKPVPAKVEPRPEPSKAVHPPPAKAPEKPAVKAPLKTPEKAPDKAAAKPVLPAKVQVPDPPQNALPRMAVVIDDLGYVPLDLVKRLCREPVPLSVAVLPFQEFTRESADLAHAMGKEVMLHLPMEPLGYPGPGKDPGPGAVMFDLKEAEIRARVRAAMDSVPHRTGVNNHMGSRITPDRPRMTWILQEIKARRFYFLDSRTEKDSVAFEVARSLKIPSVQRKVFLDDDKSFAEMAKQWERAIEIARREGEVVIIGHIYPETVEALEKLIPAARGKVRFVKAGELTR